MADAKKRLTPAQKAGQTRRKYDRAKLVPIICERLAAPDTQGLEPILREMGVPKDTVRYWRETDPDIEAQFLAARDEGYDAIAHRLRKTARGKGEDDGGDSTGDVQRDKLIVDTDLKLLAKWSPRYGDKQQVEHSGTLTLAELVAASQQK
jgi:hypothetical protein